MTIRMSVTGGRALAAVVVLLGLAHPIGATTHVVSFGLDGTQTCPPNASTGSGTCTVTIDDTNGSVSVVGTYTGLAGDATTAHIHGPAPAGSCAGILVTLAPSGGTSGTITGSGFVTPYQLQCILDGQGYVNLHSTAFPGGELRGQIEPPWDLAVFGKVCGSGLFPELIVTGDLTANSANDFTIVGAPPTAPVFLVIGISPLFAPFKGGILGPNPDFVFPLPPGTTTVPYTWPAVPAGTCVWAQFWFQDATATNGFCASATLKGTSQ